MYVHIGIVGRDRTTQLILALFVIISDSVTLGERAYNSCHARDAEQKSWDYFHQARYRVFWPPELEKLPMPQCMMDKKEEHFWLGQDLESSEGLE